jgi:mycofactocin precursor
MTNETNLESAIAPQQVVSAEEDLVRVKGDEEISEIEIFEISIDGMCGVY